MAFVGGKSVSKRSYQPPEPTPSRLRPSYRFSVDAIFARGLRPSGRNELPASNEAAKDHKKRPVAAGSLQSFLGDLRFSRTSRPLLSIFHHQRAGKVRCWHL